MSRIAPIDLYYLVVIGLIRLNELLGSSAFTHALARTLGLLAFTFSLNKKRHIRRNLDTTFGKAYNPAKMARIVRGALDDFWREMLSWSECEDLVPARAVLEIRGVAFLKTALADGKGVILWDSNGFGQRLLAKKILCREEFDVVQVHGPNNLGGFLTDQPDATWVRRAWVKPFFARREQAFVAAQINLPASDSLVYTRTLMDSLSEKQILCAAGDGRVGQKQISIRFLEHPTLFATGMLSLARLTGAAILPIFCYRHQERIRLDIGAPLVAPAGMERDAAQRAVLEQYAAQLQALIREFPEQYRNWHLLATP